MSSSVADSRYRPGQVIETAVELTANHMGHFRFRLCPVNDPRVSGLDSLRNSHFVLKSPTEEVN